jgi:hypothetical protein
MVKGMILKKDADELMEAIDKDIKRMKINLLEQAIANVESLVNQLYPKQLLQFKESMTKGLRELLDEIN